MRDHAAIGERGGLLPKVHRGTISHVVKARALEAPPKLDAHRKPPPPLVAPKLDPTVAEKTVEKRSAAAIAEVDAAKEKTARMALEGLALAVAGLSKKVPAGELVAKLERAARRAEAASADVNELGGGALSELRAALGPALESVQLTLAPAIDRLDPRSKARAEKALASLRASVASMAPPKSIDALEGTGSKAAIDEMKAALTAQGTKFRETQIDLGGGQMAPALVLEGDAKGVQLAKVAERVAKLGVELVYCPALLEAAGSAGGYFREGRQLFMDPESVRSGKPSDVVLHELRHARFDADRREGKASIFHPVLEAFSHRSLSNESDVYTKRQSAEEIAAWSKTVRHRLGDLVAGAQAGKLSGGFSDAVTFLRKLSFQTADVTGRALAILDAAPRASVHAAQGYQELHLMVPGSTVKIPLLTERQLMLAKELERVERGLEEIAAKGFVGRLASTGDKSKLEAQLRAKKSELMGSLKGELGALHALAKSQGEKALALEGRLELQAAIQYFLKPPGDDRLSLDIRRQLRESPALAHLADLDVPTIKAKTLEELVARAKVEAGALAFGVNRAARAER